MQFSFIQSVTDFRLTLTQTPAEEKLCRMEYYRAKSFCGFQWGKKSLCVSTLSLTNMLHAKDHVRVARNEFKKIPANALREESDLLLMNALLAEEIYLADEKNAELPDFVVMQQFIDEIKRAYLKERGKNAFVEVKRQILQATVLEGMVKPEHYFDMPLEEMWQEIDARAAIVPVYN